MSIVIQGDIKDWPEELRRQMQKLILQATLYLESLVVSNAPVVEGNLRDSISSQMDELQGTIVITSKYAKHVIQGTGLYGPRRKRIVPRTRKALAFNIGGERFVRRSVKGQHPNPFHFRAANKGLDKVAEIICRIGE